MSSPTPLVVFPDIEQVAVTLIRERLPAVRVGTEWPENLQGALTAGVVSVTRGGGATVQPFVTEDATLDIDILGATKKQAQDLAQQVRGWIFAAQGQPVAGARLYRVRDVSLIWLPHQPTAETDPIPRYVLVMEMRIRPA